MKLVSRKPRDYPAPRTPILREWRDDARCVGSDPYQFDEVEKCRAESSVPLRVRFTAFTHCLGCPVQVQCGAEADAGEHVGVWGGHYRTGTGKDYRKFDLLRRVREDVELGGAA